MYTPDHFAIKNTDEAYRIIEAYPLGILVTSIDEGLDANHLPFELDDWLSEPGRPVFLGAAGLHVADA